MLISKSMRKISKFICMLLIISMVWISLPYGYASAAIIGTEKAMRSFHGQKARSCIQAILAREDVQKEFSKQGIPLQEAKKRINSLTDAEAIRLAKEMEKLPAGGDALGTIVFAALFVFVVLLFTDIAGYTDVFPFVKKNVKENR